MRGSARSGGAWRISRPTASTPPTLTHMRAQLAREDLSAEDRFHFHFALGKALEDAGSYAESFEHYAQGNALRRAQVHYDPQRIRRACQALKALFTPAILRRPRRARALRPRDPIFIVGLPRAGSTLIEQILSSHSQVEGTMELPDMPALAQERRPGAPGDEGATLSAGAAAPAERGTARLGEEYLARTRIQRKTRAPVLHRQDAQQLPARRAHPSDAAERQDHRCAPPSARLLLLGLQAAFRARPEFHLRPRGHRPLLPRLRRAHGALRCGAARPGPPRPLRGHGRRHRERGARACSTIAGCRSRRAACASTRTTARCARPAPSRCASRSSARASTSGATTSRGSDRSRARSGPVLDAYPHVPEF